MFKFEELCQIALVRYDDSVCRVRDLLEAQRNERNIPNPVVFVQGDDQIVLGAISDGDLRRAEEVVDHRISTIMNSEFQFITEGHSAYSAVRKLEQSGWLVPILDRQRRLISFHNAFLFYRANGCKSNIIRVRAPVRVSFSGGGGDKAAIFERQRIRVFSATIDLYVYVSILPRTDFLISVWSDQYPDDILLSKLGEVEEVAGNSMISNAIRLMNPDTGFDMEIRSQVEPGTGLGGSSAVLSAVVEGLNQLRPVHARLSRREVILTSYQIERVIEGRAGGWQDQIACASGGFNLIEFDANGFDVHPFRISDVVKSELEYNLRLFKLPGARFSSDFHKGNVVPTPESVRMYEIYSELSRKMALALSEGSVKQFGDLLDESWELKVSLTCEGVIPQSIKNLYAKAKNIGALGGKLLGAGGTGYFLLYANPSLHEQITELFDGFGAVSVRFRFEDQGVQSWVASR